MPYDPGKAARQYLADQADRETERRLRSIGADPVTLRAVKDSEDPAAVEHQARHILAEHQRRKRAYGW